MATNHSMHQDTRASHSKAQEAQAFWSICPKYFFADFWNVMEDILLNRKPLFCKEKKKQKQKRTKKKRDVISKNDANWDHSFFKKENERAYIYSNLLSFLTISGCILLHVKKQENSMYVSCQ